ncbi:MAG: D-alanyl-D-alanine carboxypeptidase family protein [bacterium]|nr:D-alanyl-D-alanine carboxypeptidase family protein [bacterium]
MKRIISSLIAVLIFICGISVHAENNNAGTAKLETEAKACILIEASTGEVLYEDNPDEQLPIASVTKIMTMLLIMEQIEAGTLSFDTMIPVSENAMSYGGSTMFLEAGEQLSVNDMLKGIAVASANDGCVAMAEYIAGGESAFVDMMNKRASELGMKNTHFMNTNGLDEDNHYSSARDVSIMSRELMKHEKITEYTSIWTDSLRDGKFELANTNKLIRFYTGANGLKTGSTSKALCCLSAAAKRDDMQLIAVVLGAPTSVKRFESARNLLDYGFANYGIKKLASKGEEVSREDIAKGDKDSFSAVIDEDITELVKKSDNAECEKQIEIDRDITAPIHAGDRVGTIRFMRGDTEIDSAAIVSAEDVEKEGIKAIMVKFMHMIIGG